MMLSAQYLTKVDGYITGWNMLLRHAGFAIIALSLSLCMTNGHAQEPSELQQLRDLILQQQCQIEAPKQHRGTAED